MREFLAKFEDVEYSSEPHDDEKELGRDLGSEAGTRRASGGPPRPDAAAGHDSCTFAPPGACSGPQGNGRRPGGAGLGGNAARRAAAGVEIAYVVKALQELVPNKYRDVAIAAAKDLLANPPAIDRPNRLDENAKNYLYGVLSMYNDQSFATVAQSLLVTQDGRVDRTALSYLTGTLKEEAVPALYQAFKDSRVTNMWERASLVTQIFSYAGSNSQANDVLKEVVNNETLPSWLRATAIQAVAGGRGAFFGGPSPTDLTQIKARIDLLNSLPEITDERLARARIEAIQKLSETLATDGDEAASGRSFRTRLGQGQGTVEMPPPLPLTR